jgi:hypothetical protein
MSDSIREQSSRPLHVVRDKDYEVIFANHLRMRLSPSDIGVVFGLMDEMPGLGLTATERVMAIMTPHVAKQLAVGLGEAIRLFEEKYGEIRPVSNEPIDAGKIESALKKITE